MGSQSVVAIVLCGILLSPDFALIFAYYSIYTDVNGCSCDEIILRINCSATGMQSLPVGLPEDYYSLYFNFNNVTFLNEESFNVSSLTNIHELSIIASNVFDVEDDVLGSLNALLWLDMKDNFLRALPYGIDQMPDLQMLDLSGNLISLIPLDSFNSNHRLSTLFLDRNYIDIHSLDRGVFSNLDNLRTLSVSSKSIQYSYEAAGEVSYSNLTGNNYSQCLNVSSLFDQPQTNVLTLLELRLNSNGIRCFPSGTFNDWFVNLQILDFGHNQIATLTEDIFQPLIHLEQLILESNQLQIIPSTVFTTNFALRVLILKNNQLETLSDSVIFPISESIEWLDVSNNRLHTWNGTARGEYTRLEHLNLISNSIAGDEPIQFTNIRRLRTLMLSFNKLTYFPNVTRLRHLEVLKLAYNRIKDLPLQALQGCRQLKELKMRHNLLQTVDESIVTKPRYLEVLTLQSNPLVCDCNLKWLGDPNTLSDAFYNMVFSSTCDSPKFLSGKPIGDVLQDNPTDLICNEFSDPTSMVMLVSIWLLVIALIVCFKLYQTFPFSRRKYRAIAMGGTVGHGPPAIPGLIKKERLSIRYRRMSEVDVEKQPRRLSSPSSPESPIKSLPSNIQWAKIPETQV